ncbi:4-hydroxythreonine-4-phosphate dehydrogenase PdxA, partial [Amphibiibacter pelophylacis]
MTAPLIAITQGDACGIGPETILQAWARGAVPRGVVLGHRAVMQRALDALCGAHPGDAALAALRLLDWTPGEGAAALEGLAPHQVPVWTVPGPWPHPDALLAACPWGQISAAAGDLAHRAIAAGVQLCLDGTAQALVTAPIHKEALARAGVNFPGHTEMLARYAQPDSHLPPLPVRMMLANEALRTVLVTVHVALREAIALVTEEAVLDAILQAHRSAPLWGQARPRIAVAGLNPHAGEGGLFGHEETDIIAPAIARARAAGVDASGPYAGDTVFMRARHAPPEHPGEFDVVIAMYHDQGLIPVKYMGLEQGVNVTLGLPFLRTSPDHGTAFDLA